MNFVITLNGEQNEKEMLTAVQENSGFSLLNPGERGQGHGSIRDMPRPLNPYSIKMAFLQPSMTDLGLVER